MICTPWRRIGCDRPVRVPFAAPAPNRTGNEHRCPADGPGIGGLGSTSGLWTASKKGHKPPC
jgi:hypothetical protein